jgi:hypothetical protein
MSSAASDAASTSSPGATETLALCVINCGAWRLASEHADLTAQQDNVEIAIHPNLPELYRKKSGDSSKRCNTTQPARRLSKPSARLSTGSKSCPARRAAAARSPSWVHWPRSWLLAKKRPPPRREVAVRP